MQRQLCTIVFCGLQLKHKSGTCYVVLALSMRCWSVHIVSNGTWHQTTLGQSAIIYGWRESKS